MKKSYNQYVEEAKGFLKNIEETKFKISKLALEVCQIRHGGISTQYYTLKDFAGDIGMKPKTLQNWVRIYRDILLVCEKPNPSPTDWKNAGKVENILKNKRTVSNKEEGTQGTLSQWNKKVPKSTINDIFSSIESGEEQDLNLNRLYRQSKHCKFLLSKIDMGASDRSTLIEIMSDLDIVSDTINDYLSSNPKGVAC